MSLNLAVPAVLTLEEAAEYLRIGPDVLERQAAEGRIPARQIDGSWRFLRTAMEDWLRTESGRTTLLRQAGTLADDESLPQMRADIYKSRGRPETESHS